MTDDALAEAIKWLVIGGVTILVVCVVVYLVSYVSGRGWHRAKREHLHDLFLDAQRKDEVNGQG